MTVFASMMVLARMRRRLHRAATLLAGAAIFLLHWANESGAAEQPQRIVSLNLCTDQLVLDLVPAARIAALSRLAADPKLSAVASRIGGTRLTGGAAEDVLALDPDLVVTADHAAPATVALLRRLGRRVVTLPMAADFDGYRANVRALAAAVGETQRGDRLVANFDARLATANAHAAQPGDRRPTALSWEINRLTAGAATLVDAEMRAAGLDNAARRLALGADGVLPLETIVSDPPDVLVLANAADDYPTAAADNLRHPALADAMRGREVVHLPMPLWLCAGPQSVDAVEMLAAARARVAAKAVRR